MPANDSSRASHARTLADRLRALAPPALASFERDHPRAALLAFAALPALVAGFELAVLTLFLNHERRSLAAALSLGTLAGALLLLPLSLAAHLGGARWRGVRVSRLVPWSMTVVLVAAALGDWVHASRYSFHLAPAMGANLIKLALWLSLAAILYFYTALLHTLHHRRYGAKSAALLLFVGVGVVYVSLARLTSYSPPATAARGVPRLTAPAPRLVVVTIDGASLDVFLPLARQGRLPFFSALVEAGATARLETVRPVEPLAARATLATGKLPWRHLVVSETIRRSPFLPFGDLRLVPSGFAATGLAPRARSTAAGDRQALATAEILARAGARVAIVGEPSALALPNLVAAAAPDERFRGHANVRARPAALEGQLELLADAGGDASQFAAGIESAAEGELALRLGAALAQDRWRAAVATALIAPPERFDAVFVALPGFAEIALETRAGFEAAALEGARGRAERDAAELLTRYAGEIDALLARLWEKLEPPRLLAVVSAYGVDRPRGAERWAREIGRTRRLAGTIEGESDGALWLLGERLARPGVSIARARTVDLAPTLLYLAGLPIARDFDGRVLTEAVDPELLARQPLTFLPSYGAPPAPPVLP